MADEFDIVVAGGGIAGLTAGLTAARRGRKTLVLAGDIIGGQLLSIEKVDGYPGFPDGIPGYDLGPIAQEQAMNAGAEFAAAELTGIAADGNTWKLTSGEGDYIARSVIMATGCSLKSLGVPGEERLQGKGVSDCATCDGPLMKNKPIAVVGGGDSAMQEALTLAAFGSKVVILQNRPALTGQKFYRDLIAANSKIEVRPNTTVEEILGDATVSAVRIRDMSSGASSEMEAAGVFIFVGLQSNSELAASLLKLDASGRIPTDGALRAERKGLTAAGTVRSGTSCRAASSAGDGATAAETLDRYLTDGAWRS